MPTLPRILIVTTLLLFTPFAAQLVWTAATNHARTQHRRDACEAFIQGQQTWLTPADLGLALASLHDALSADLAPDLDRTLAALGALPPPAPGTVRLLAVPWKHDRSVWFPDLQLVAPDFTVTAAAAHSLPGALVLHVDLRWVPGGFVPLRVRGPCGEVRQGVVMQDAPGGTGTLTVSSWRAGRPLRTVTLRITPP